MAIPFQGFVYTNAGVAVSGATVELFDKNTTTPVRATTTTDANGYFAISHATIGTYDVKVTNGASVRWIKHDDARQFEFIALPPGTAGAPSISFNAGDDGIYSSGDGIVDFGTTGVQRFKITDNGMEIVSGAQKLIDDLNIALGSDSDAVMRWSTGDADNHSMVIGLGDSNQSLHVTDKAAVATDWNISADTHPTLYIHSNTTPATDYLRLGGHDGTTAAVDVVGGTTLELQIGGTAAVSLTANELSLSISTAGTIASGAITNSDNTNTGSHARLSLNSGGSSGGDPFVRFDITGVQNWYAGVDNTNSDNFAIGVGTTVGSQDTLRCSTANPSVFSLDTTQGADFDYVCETCGAHALELFVCCGPVAWHDDVGALVALAGRPQDAMEHMARIGVLTISENNDGTPWVGVNIQPAMDYTWSAMRQLWHNVNQRLEAGGL